MEYYFRQHNDNNYDKNSVNDAGDKARIIDDMKGKMTKQQFKNWCSKGLFYHADNIRYVYDECNLKCPEWFITKYKHLLD